MARKSIAVDQNVYEEFALQASRQNKTLFSFANESLALISQLSMEGGTPDALKSVWRTVSILKEMDAVTLPGDFVDEVICKFFSYDKESLLKMFRELGTRLVPLLKTIAEDMNNLSVIAKDFKTILPVKHLDIAKKEEGIEVLVVGAGRRIESTACMAEFVHGVLDGYYYSVVKQELSTGIIRILAARRGPWKQPQTGQEVS